MSNPPIQIKFPPAQRANESDARLYSFAEIPSMDRAGEDYVLHLTVRAADSDQERAIADTCTRAINSAGQTTSALHMALVKLDSVAFLAVEGDTDQVKKLIISALQALGAPLSLGEQAPEANRTKTPIEAVKVGDTIEVPFETGPLIATVELINEGILIRTLHLCSGGTFYELSVERGDCVSLVR